MIDRWQCECGKIHSLDERYCDNCGKSIPDSVLNAIVREECREYIEYIFLLIRNRKQERYLSKYGTITCPKCGQTLTGASNYCKQCGAELKEITIPAAKTRVIAIILAVFLGCFGIQNFYLGYFIIGIVQLIIAILAMLTKWKFFGFLLTVSYICSFIQAILLFANVIKEDSYGIPLK